MIQLGNKIKLPNRYGNKNYLETIGENTYRLILDDNNHYLRVLGIDTIEAIDPEGGPYMQVGEIIKGIGTLVKIEQNESFVLTFDI